MDCKETAAMLNEMADMLESVRENYVCAGPDCTRKACTEITEMVREARKKAAITIAAQSEALDVHEALEKDLAAANMRTVRLRVKLDSLAEAARAVIVRWDSIDWKGAEHTGVVINRLLAALTAIGDETT